MTKSGGTLTTGITVDKLLAKKQNKEILMDFECRKKEYEITCNMISPNVNVRIE